MNACQFLRVVLSQGSVSLVGLTSVYLIFFTFFPPLNLLRLYGMRDPPLFIPAPVERYRQILLPALQLCQVILTSSMAQHLQAAGQVSSKRC